MTKTKIETMKPLSAGILAAAALWLSATFASAQVAITDIGAAPPTPGPNDISQLNFNGGQPGGLNYYFDNGANNNDWMGQSFTTGNYPSGYVLTNLVIGTSGNGGGNQLNSQSFSLYIFQLSGAGLTTATTVASYTAVGQLNTESDWLQWNGLALQLLPNTTYAYGFGRDSSGSGWERLATTNGWPYQGGQVCAIPKSGGTVTYSSSAGTYDAAFDVGLALVGAPLVSAPSYTNSSPIDSGTPVTLTELAAGEAPLSYQWQTDGGSGGALTNIPGAILSSLTVDTTAFSGTYSYQVIVANAAGTATSPVVQLSVSTAAASLATDISPFQQIYAFVGQPLQFSAAFTGSLPITYQWLDETLTATNTVGQNTNVLTLPGVKMTDAGTYQLMASNVYSAANGGPVFSSTTALGVIADPAAPTPKTDPYGALVLSYGPYAFWELNETNVDPASGISPAFDFSGHGFFGLYGTDAYTGYGGAVQGPQPPLYPGFPTNQTAMQTAQGDTNSDCSVPSLRLNTNAVSFTMWINPTQNAPNWAGLFFYRGANDGDAAGLGFGGAQNASGMAALGFTWNTNSGSTYNWNSGLFPVVGIWQYVALVIQPTNATIYLYYLDPDTQQPHLYYAENTMAYTPEAFETVVQSGAGIWIGNNRGGITAYPGPVFNGDICDVAVFNYSLTQPQVLGLFSEGVGISQFAPSISTQPKSTEAYPGTTVQFSAGGISGTAPLSYQWQLNSTNLPGATNVSLVLSNVTAANNGSYQLVITNVVGSTVSSSATLSVVPLPPQNLLGRWFAGAASTADVSGYSPAGTHDAYDIGNGSYFFTNDVPPNETGVSLYLNNDGFLVTNSATVDNNYVNTYDDTITNSFTVMCWAKGYPGGWGPWVSKYGESGAGWQLRVDGGNTPCFTIRGTGGNEDMEAPNTSNDGNWHHYAGTYDVVTGNRYLYVDGNVVVSESGQGAYALSPDTELCIGAKDQPSGDNFTGFYTGEIYDVRIYTDAVTQTFIQAIVAGPTPKLTSQFNASANQLVLTWSAGTLLQATNLLGPWVAFPNATSPQTNSVTAAPQRFFRVSNP